MAVRAIKALGAIHDPHIAEFILKELKSENRYGRRMALIEMSGEQKDPGTVEALIELLEPDEDYFTSLTIIQALGATGDAGAVDSLLALLEENGQFDYSEYIIPALAKIKDTRVVEPLLAYLKTGHNSLCLEAAAEALGEIKETGAVEPVIDLLKRDNNRRVVNQRVLIKALEKINDPRVVIPLIKFILSNYDYYEDDERLAADVIIRMKDLGSVEFFFYMLEVFRQKKDYDIPKRNWFAPAAWASNKL